MEEFIVSAISLIILVPIIYFLPIGLTKKGKGILIAVAFIIANLGLLAKNSFPLWQAALILLLMVMLTVYILDKRLGNLLFSGVHTDEKSDREMSDLLLADDEQSANLKEVSVPDRNLVGDVPLSIQVPEEELREIINKEISFEKNDPLLIEEEPLEIDVLLFDKDEKEMIEEVIETNENFVTQEMEDEVVVSKDEFDLDEEISFLSDREQVLENHSVENQESSLEQINGGYMSEIEKLLLEEELPDKNLEIQLIDKNNNEDTPLFKIEESEDVQDQLDMENQSDVLEIELLTFVEPEGEGAVSDFNNEQDQIDEEAQYEESEIELLTFEDNPFEEAAKEVAENDFDYEQDQMEEEDTQTEEPEIELLLFEDILLEETLNEVAVSESEGDQGQVDVDNQTEGLVPLELVEEPTLEDEIKETEVYAKDVSLPIENEEAKGEDQKGQYEPVELDNQTRLEQKTTLQQKMFHLMISQLHLSKKQMKPDDYETLLKEYLHPELPAQDYFTFVSLLIEHYISHKDIGKLEDLLVNLKGKFIEYPILEMEIQFLYEHYCENAREMS